MSKAMEWTSLPLAEALTRRTSTLCRGLEHGEAEVLAWVTPETAALLRWWFADEHCRSRDVNFHVGQRQAILNAIVAHEVLGSICLMDLYQQVCPEILLENDLMADVAQARHAHPKYCLKMAASTGKTWVLQALMVWQVLNRTATQAQGRSDPRFTRRFLVVASGRVGYERLLDAFLGRVREEGSGRRDFSRSDLSMHGELFVPPGWRETMRQFVLANTCGEHEIGRKTTGTGLIAISHWQLLQEAGEDARPLHGEVAMVASSGVDEPHAGRQQARSSAPVESDSIALATRRRRWQHGHLLAYLASFPDLMVFNDEVHRIHAANKAGELDDVEWQRGLARLARGKGRRFVQVDFSATPYNDVGVGRHRRKVYFPHIIVDIDLMTAMKAGLVKSLVLDRRRELGALPLEVQAGRDAAGHAGLSEGQRVMLRAGLKRLRKLEADFARLDPDRRPKMLVLCEDAQVTARVELFLVDEGVGEDDVLRIDSGRKAELDETTWASIRQRLCEVDRQAVPRVIVSLSRLREAFDVSTICVIVPLRAPRAPVLLEQTLGRGLRLMWRDEAYQAIRRENRGRIARGEQPGSLIDVLTVVEHPAFAPAYQELMRYGLAGTIDEAIDAVPSAGDLMPVSLRDGFERYDVAVPVLLRDAGHPCGPASIDVASLAPFTAMDRAELARRVGPSGTATSRNRQGSALSGAAAIDAAMLGVSGYDEWLSRLVRRIGRALSALLPDGQPGAGHLCQPYLQTGSGTLVAVLDQYVRERLFGEVFEPLADEGWRLLLLQPVVDHVVRGVALALVKSEHHPALGEAEVHHRLLSEVPGRVLRKGHSMAVRKCIYPRLPYSSRDGLERCFMAWADRDAGIQAFCTLQAHRHGFVRLRYVGDDDLVVDFGPDLLVRTAQTVYLVETAAPDPVTHPNVQRRLCAAAAWCARVNRLPPDRRDGRDWQYAIVVEPVFFDWHDRNASLVALLDHARVRSVAGRDARVAFDFAGSGH